MAYSPFFQVLHDERAPVGNLGRGTHYTVVRTVLPVPESREVRTFSDDRRPRLELLTLAVIWDEDHDERIWGVIERLHAAGLLAPVRFIGERKGNVTIICDAATAFGTGGYDLYRDLVEEMVYADDGDEWSLELQLGIGNGSCQIIHASQDRVDAYLRGIEASWTLGPSDWIFRRKTIPDPTDA
ncbi:hypothetical protein QTH90_23870 [Variovorax sp. J2P1-59]|uniref:hypothetical protein n=1 Tax=Variovorax flavidus TaxID=3053501 RepID=UPI0025772B0C|nr:hypothetical protein [Variovorax sp. J2P1-59]MDM0077465.1 hypothetical protein [Variovorax sp. J2P1-59]